VAVVDHDSLAAARSASFEKRLRNRELVVGVLGLGYVGLPLAAALAEAGFECIAFDPDARKVEQLLRGESYLSHFSSERVAKVVARHGLRPTTIADSLRPVDVAIIAVPTPLSDGLPDLTNVIAAARTLSAHPRAERLVLLESTVFPKATEEIVRPLLDQTGALGKDYFLAFSPEREDPGNTRFVFTEVPKVVGALDPQSLIRARAFYLQLFREVVPVSSARTAEAVKLAENVFRAVNVALVNELKVAFEAMNVDVWEVLEAAATKPFGYMMFRPGPGVGGHCIPIDPHYLVFQAKMSGAHMPLTEAALALNAEGPRLVVARLERLLAERGRSLTEVRILVVGVAYKKDIDDVRESPALAILDLLLEEGATVIYHDPLVHSLGPAYEKTGASHSRPLDAETINGVHAVIVATDHSAVDYALIRENAALVLDTRGVYREPFERLFRA
jgi:UDP-N-acetyl-D-glucosamine dehydrogenase